MATVKLLRQKATLLILNVIHSIIHSCIYLFIHSFSQSFIHSITHSFINLFILHAICLARGSKPLRKRFLRWVLFSASS